MKLDGVESKMIIKKIRCKEHNSEIVLYTSKV